MTLPDLVPAAPDGRIVSLETVRSERQRNVLWVLLTADDGTVGLGETFYGASVVEEYLHSQVAPLLFAEPRPAPQLVARRLQGYVGYSGSGAEVRGGSAVDIALWDLLGRQVGRPLRQLLGGPLRDSIPVYNTCAGNDYVSTSARQVSSNWGVGSAGTGRYEDLAAFLHHPADLARDLRDEGYRGLKVWPFDLAAEEADGAHTADLRPGLAVLDAIREAVGDELDLYVELHSLWQPRGAERLLRALAPYGIRWAEDPVRPDQVQTLAALRSATGVPIAVGENLGAGYNSFHPLLQAGGTDVAIIDIGWSGGVTAAVKTAALAEQYGIPVAPHDCTGPVALAVATHVVTTVPNGFVQEVARAFYHGWYADVATGLPVLGSGVIAPAEEPGHGVTLTPALLAAPGTTTRRSTTTRTGHAGSAPT